MTATQNPPVRAPLTSNGFVTELWKRWFINVGRLTDPELVSNMPTVPTATENNFAAFNTDGQVKDSGKTDSDYADAVHVHGNIVTRTITGDTILTSTDFGKIIIANNGAADINITAPPGGPGIIGSVLKIVRLGSGWLKVYPDGSDTIQNGSVGGFIMSSEAGRTANIELVLVTATKWAINGGLGIWLNF